MIKLPIACDQYGSDMGRRNVVEEPDAPIKFRLCKMPINKGGYDSAGAYWGGATKQGVMFMAWGDGPKFENQLFVRARNRTEAKFLVMERFVNAQFYR